jgi:hypothetical protein
MFKEIYSWIENENLFVMKGKETVSIDLGKAMDSFKKQETKKSGKEVAYYKQFLAFATLMNHVAEKTDSDVKINVRNMFLSSMVCLGKFKMYPASCEIFNSLSQQIKKEIEDSRKVWISNCDFTVAEGKVIGIKRL